MDRVDLRRNEFNVSTKKINILLEEAKYQSHKKSEDKLHLEKTLEKQLQRKVNTAFRRFTRSSVFLYRETGIYESEVARDRLNEELFPVMISFYRKVFLAMYSINEEYYNRALKDEAEAVVFGKNKDVEILVKEYFKTKELILAGISARQANLISKEIEKLRATRNDSASNSKRSN